MIADIKGKLARDGSNLHERVEDNLTGNVFGALRYVPSSLGFVPIFRRAVWECVPSVADRFRHCIDTMTSTQPEVKFWHTLGDEGEIDVLIETPNCVLGIEVKLDSGLSSDDQVDHSTEGEERTESGNQLARYSRGLAFHFPDVQSRFLLFVSPVEMAWAVKDAVARKLIHPNVCIGSLTWQDVLESLEESDGSASDPYHKIVLSDLRDLLRSKGLEHFKGFTTQDFVSEASFYYNSSERSPTT